MESWNKQNIQLLKEVIESDDEGSNSKTAPAISLESLGKSHEPTQPNSKFSKIVPEIKAESLIKPQKQNPTRPN